MQKSTRCVGVETERFNLVEVHTSTQINTSLEIIENAIETFPLAFVIIARDITSHQTPNTVMPMLLG